MNDLAQNVRPVSPGWLWGLRLATVVAGFPGSFLAVRLLQELHLHWNENPLAKWGALALGARLAILLSAVSPYLCILWHTRKTSPPEKGRVWAMGTGGAWLAFCVRSSRRCNSRSRLVRLLRRR